MRHLRLIQPDGFGRFHLRPPLRLDEAADLDGKLRLQNPLVGIRQTEVREDVAAATSVLNFPLRSLRHFLHISPSTSCRHSLCSSPACRSLLLISSRSDFGIAI